MEIIRDIEQGSEEWLKLRLGKATASNFSKIVTGTGIISKSLPKYAISLAGEMIINELEDGFKSKFMERGNELEGDAVDAYQEYSFNLVDTVSFIDCGDYGCSPDGLVGENGMIEAKVPSQSVHALYLQTNKLPAVYKQQVQGGLYVAEREWCDFISFNPTFLEKYKLLVIRVFRDEEYIDHIKKGIDQAVHLRDRYYNDIIGRDVVDKPSSESCLIPHSNVIQSVTGRFSPTVDTWV